MTQILTSNFYQNESLLEGVYGLKILIFGFKINGLD